eukprot:scaffold159456_cov28-Tisochrysis_lutea.AAC.3
MLSLRSISIDSHAYCTRTDIIHTSRKRRQQSLDYSLGIKLDQGTIQRLSKIEYRAFMMLKGDSHKSRADFGRELAGPDNHTCESELCLHLMSSIRVASWRARRKKLEGGHDH